MRCERVSRRFGVVWLLAGVLVLGGVSKADAQDKGSLEVYGFAMLDIGHDFKQINPNWFDTMRVTKLPSFEKEFGEDHNTFAGVRQTRFGVRSSTPTSLEVRNWTPSASICTARRLTRCFSSLKSGMPYRSSPPIRSAFSNTVTA